MSGFFRKKTLKILSPMDGQIIPISNIADEVFANKLIGDGVAVQPTSGIIMAPVNGILKMIFKTNHAFAIETADGIEILIHVGLDTVELKGCGFKRLQTENTKVKVGTPVIEVDLELLKKQQKISVTPVLITSMYKIANIKITTNSIVKGGIDYLMICTLN